MRIRILKLSAIAFFISASAVAQDKVTLSDAKEINYQAGQTVRDLADLINYVTEPKVNKSALIETITSSYSRESRNRIFYSDSVVIENDIDPLSGLGKTNDVQVKKYFTDLNLSFDKVDDSKFEINHISSIKKQDFLFVCIRFSAKFNGTNKVNHSAYPVKQREALIRLERLKDNKWNALIQSVYFYDPSNDLRLEDKNITVTIDSSANSTTLSQEELAKEIKRDSLIRDQEIKRKEAIFNDYIASADSLEKTGQFKESKELLSKAKEMKQSSLMLDMKFIHIDKLIADNTIENLKREGDIAKNEHRFNDAVLFYKKALAQNPQLTDVKDNINHLTQKIKEIELPTNRLQSGDLQGAVDECESILKTHKNDKNECAELYYIKAEAYRLMADKKPGDDADQEKALKNYALAIQYFPNYISALIARAGFYVKFKNDLFHAISDYDVLTTNALDDSVTKPHYYAVKAKWKAAIGNYVGSIDDYKKAIALSKKDSLYFRKGELLYRLNNFKDAQKDLDMAIQLNDRYTSAYYTRGFNQLALKNIAAAGKDFLIARKLGLDKDSLKNIDAKSKGFFLSGVELMNNHDLVNADIAYVNALYIDSCNAYALNGRAEIHFIKGKELIVRKNDADAQAEFKESIDLNKNAITCKPDYAGAYFKMGLAQKIISENENAISGFSNAIENNREFVDAFLERGNTYLLIGKDKEAANDFSQALTVLDAFQVRYKKTNNKDSIKLTAVKQSLLNQLAGRALFNLSNFPDAKTALNKAIELDENNAEAYYYQGLVSYATTEYSGAIKNYEKALKKQADPRYYYASGSACLKNKNYTGAVSAFTSAIQLDTINALKDKYHLRGLSYFRGKSYPEAIADLDLYNKSDNSKTDTTFYVDYGIVQLFAERDTAAANSFNRALQLSAQNHKAQLGLGCYYARTKQYDKMDEPFKLAFAERELSKEDIALFEDTFYDQLSKDKRLNYNKEKKNYKNKFGL